MKYLTLPLFVLCALTVCGQTATTWLELTPVKVEKPALADIKDVNNKVFAENMLLEHSGINVATLSPDENRKENAMLSWQRAAMSGDTIVAPKNSAHFNLSYYAVYISNSQWTEGTLSFKLFGNAEVYLDGAKKTTTTTDKPTEKSVSCELVPGKHTLIVKSVNQGGKLVSVSFKPENGCSDVQFTISPLRGKNIYDILNTKQVTHATISPSGKYALIGMSSTEEGKSSSMTTVCRVDNHEVVYSFFGGVGQMEWMPNTDVLTFSRQEGVGTSLYSYDVEGQQQRCVVYQHPLLKSYTWAPDGSYLIYYTQEDYSEKNWELRKLAGIEDRQAYYRNRSYLCKYDLSSGVHSRLTWGNLTTALLDISPDSKQLLFTTSFPDYNEFPYRKQSIYMLNIETMQVDTLWKDRLIGISCSFSPNGKQLLITGGASAFGKEGEYINKGQIVNQYDTKLYLYDLATKQATPITRRFEPSVSDAQWHHDGNIYLQGITGEYVYLYRFVPQNGSITPIECPGEIVNSFSLSKKGNTIMYTASNVSSPTSIYTLSLPHDQAALWDSPERETYRDIVFGEVKEWDYEYNKNTLINGRYYLPADFDPNKKYPLIVNYYGGTTPVGRDFGGRYPLNLYAANGYIVYVMQPSGTIGYGQEFAARHQNNWCKITGDEIIASTKAFIKTHPFVDATKVGCIGASYGGFTTMYLTTHTDLFACAISHAGISSLAGYWGDGYWGYSYSTNATAHSFPWNRKDLYVDQSPLFSADKAHNPILLIHGTKDVNVPTAQSIQFYTALKLLGKDAELVFVKDADHQVLEYDQRILWNNTILAYFDKYLKKQPLWWKNIYKDQNL